MSRKNLPRILVVEDETIVAEDLKARLISLGYTVVGYATTGEEAIRLAFQTLPDLILMDIVLRGSIDGVEATAKIQEKLDIPVIYITAFSDSVSGQRIKSQKRSHIIVKPFEENELNRCIVEVLRTSHTG